MLDTNLTSPIPDGIILPDSLIAAVYGTATGWISRQGFFYGEGELGERAARYAGATHIRCEGCQRAIIAKTLSLCDACHQRKDIRDWEAASKEVWGGDTLIYSDTQDRYFRDLDDLGDSLFDLSIRGEDHQNDPYDYDYETIADALASLRLYVCAPTYCRELETDDFADDLPDFYEAPDALQDAIAAFNAAMKAYDTPLSYSPTKAAVDVVALAERLNTGRAEGGGHHG